jgi:hypothetical protein
MVMTNFTKTSGKMSTENLAPEWAAWIAQDADGTWWWYEKKPIRQPHHKAHYSRTGRRRMVWPEQPEEVSDWTKSLQKIEK